MLSNCRSSTLTTFFLVCTHGHHDQTWAFASSFGWQRQRLDLLLVQSFAVVIRAGVPASTWARARVWRLLILFLACWRNFALARFSGIAFETKSSLVSTTIVCIARFLRRVNAREI